MTLGTVAATMGAMAVLISPLIGRDNEFELAVRALRGGRGVFIAGPAGVGKSRLSAEVQSACATTHGAVTVHASETRRAFAFGALAPLLTSLAADADIHSFPQMFAAAISSLNAMPNDRRVLLVVDDVHWLDDGSSALVAALVEEDRLDVICTLRTGEPTPHSIQRLWSDELIERIDLAELDRQNTVQLAERLLGQTLEQPAAQEIFRASRGNPLLIRELIRATGSGGTMALCARHWGVDNHASLSPRIIELIETTLAALTEEQRHMLGLIAVGEPVPLGVLGSLINADDLASLERSGAIAVRPPSHRPMIEVGHPLYSEVIRKQLTTSDMRRIWTQLVGAWHTQGAPSAHDHVRVSLWQYRAGLPADPAALLRAAQLARVSDDFIVAGELASAAISANAGARASYLLGEIHDYVGQSEMALQVLDSAMPDGADETALIGMARTDATFWGMCDADGALAISVAVERAVAGTRWVPVIQAHRAKVLSLQARFDESLQIAEPLLGHDDPRVVADACYPAAVAWGQQGNTARAIAVSDRGAELRRQVTDEQHMVAPEMFSLICCLHRADHGDVTEAWHNCVADLDEAVAARRLGGAVWAGLTLGRINLLTGRFDDSMRLLNEHLGLLANTNSDGYSYALMHLALTHAQRGEGEATSGALDRWDIAPAHATRTLDRDIERARAWRLVCDGQLSTAADLLLCAAHDAESAGQLLLASLAAYDAARIGFPDLALPHLQRLGLLVSGPLTAARVDHAAALYRHDGASLDAVSARFEAMGAIVAAAEAAAHAATAWRLNGLRRQASGSGRRADELRARCTGLMTPAFVGIDAPVLLTRREREIALLVGSGLSTPDVAARLILGVRTVESHLNRIYTKLGVTQRSDLAGALRSSGS